jgi:hypothetical protein
MRAHLISGGAGFMDANVIMTMLKERGFADRQIVVNEWAMAMYPRIKYFSKEGYSNRLFGSLCRQKSYGGRGETVLGKWF